MFTDTDEPWKKSRSDAKYFPLQAQVGDLAVYLHENAIEVEFNNQIM
jgi:hypothetical protein